MKNFRSLVVNEIRAAGCEFSKSAKHGDIYVKGDLVIEVPRQVKTRKIANHFIRLARREP